MNEQERAKLLDAFDEIVGYAVRKGMEPNVLTVRAIAALLRSEGGRERVECDYCDGRGKVGHCTPNPEPCPDCGGRGYFGAPSTPASEEGEREQLADALLRRAAESDERAECYFPEREEAKAHRASAQLDREAATLLWPKEGERNLKARLEELRPNAHRQLSLEESYALLVRLFGEVGEAHVAISRSGLRVRGMGISERVKNVLALLRAPSAASEGEDPERCTVRRHCVLDDGHEGEHDFTGAGALVRAASEGVEPDLSVLDEDDNDVEWDGYCANCGCHRMRHDMYGDCEEHDEECGGFVLLTRPEPAGEEEPRCKCGHLKADHYHGLGMCDRLELSFGCQCRRFRRAPQPIKGEEE